MKPRTLLVLVIILVVFVLGLFYLFNLHSYSIKLLDVGFSSPCIYDEEGRIQFTLVLYVNPYPKETLIPKKVYISLDSVKFEAKTIIPLSNKTFGEALSPGTFTDFKVLFETNRNLTFYYNAQKDIGVEITYTSGSSSQIGEAGTKLRISKYCHKNESVI